MMKYSFKHLFIDINNSKKIFQNNWVRTILSSIGIIIGVASIVMIISISEYAKEESINNFKNMGLKTIRVENKDLSILSKQTENLSQGLTFKDYEYISNTINRSGKVTPVYKNKNETLVYKNSDFTSNIYGGNSFFFDIEEIKIINGRNILPIDIEKRSNVCILSSDISKRYNIKVGELISIGKYIYIVVGISSTKDSLSNFIFLPYSAYPIYKTNFDEINSNIYNQEMIYEKSKLIEKQLSILHKDVDDFKILIPFLLLEKKQKTNKLFSTVILCIAIVSLLTGGISVMNIMLSNISEQTREIGLRLALGATQKRILVQYFIHTYTLTFLSGLAGIILGYILIILISFFSNISFAFSSNALISSVIMTIVCGVLFGIYPAQRASKIEPIIALKEI